MDTLSTETHFNTEPTEFNTLGTFVLYIFFKYVELNRLKIGTKIGRRDVLSVEEMCMFELR